MMYALIWVAFIEILIVLFPVIGTWPTYDLHLVVGVVVLGLAYRILVQVSATSCPGRIKRIAKATFGFAVFQALLGAALYGLLSVNVGGTVVDFINFLHVAVALAIITQASSSATAFDMWEEKEFMPVPESGATLPSA
jgi:cytochrome b561